MPTILPSWNEGDAKQAILDFGKRVTQPDSPDFVPESERIAVFDNDGTLWCEKPMYIQLDYLLRQMAVKAENDSSLRSKQPWKAAWEKDFDWLGGAITKHYQGDDRDLKVLMGGLIALSEGQPVMQVETAARDFLEKEKHPLMDILYRDCIYQPILELLRYLESLGFSNYIVSGGGRDFMRGFSLDLYGIPRQRVIGTTVAYRYVEGDIYQKAELDVLDDGHVKPLQIWNVIGQHPILAAGNSNGDIEMLEFAQSSGKPFLNLLVHHDDAEREYAYEKGAEKALELASELNWQVVSMQKDFGNVFP